MIVRCGVISSQRKSSESLAFLPFVLHFQETMSSCKHTSWLDYTHTTEVVLWDTGRLSRMSLELTNPARQRPSLILFVGRKSKDFALRDLFPWNNIERSRREGLVTLRADTLSLHSDFPVFFAESDPFNAPVHSEASACHEASPWPLRWTLSAGHSLYAVCVWASGCVCALARVCRMVRGPFWREWQGLMEFTVLFAHCDILALLLPLSPPSSSSPMPSLSASSPSQPLPLPLSDNRDLCLAPLGPTEQSLYTAAVSGDAGPSGR